MKKVKQKFDNMSSNVKSYGTMVKEGARVLGLKAKIRQRKAQASAVRRMAKGRRLQAKDSLGLSDAVNKSKGKW